MRELPDLYNALANYGDDSELEVAHFAESELAFSLSLDVANGEKYTITLPHPGHVDIAPRIFLGSIVFGGLDLLPENYLNTRWNSWQSEDNLKVAKITDEYDKQYFVVYHGAETIELQTE